MMSKITSRAAGALKTGLLAVCLVAAGAGAASARGGHGGGGGHFGGGRGFGGGFADHVAPGFGEHAGSISPVGGFNAHMGPGFGEHAGSPALRNPLARSLFAPGSLR